MKPWILYALGSMFFAGLTSVVAKLGMKNVPADIALVVRTLFVSLFIVVNVLLFQQVSTIRSLTRSDIGYLAVSALTTTLSWIFYYRAIKEGNVSVVASIDKASIVITILIALLFLKEPFTPRLLAGAGLIIAGTIILVWK